MPEGGWWMMTDEGEFFLLVDGMLFEIKTVCNAEWAAEHRS